MIYIAEGVARGRYYDTKILWHGDMFYDTETGFVARRQVI
jgi:hypothetical protein